MTFGPASPSTSTLPELSSHRLPQGVDQPESNEATPGEVFESLLGSMNSDAATEAGVTIRSFTDAWIQPASVSRQRLAENGPLEADSGVESDEPELNPRTDLAALLTVFSPEPTADLSLHFSLPVTGQTDHESAGGTAGEAGTLLLGDEDTTVQPAANRSALEAESFSGRVASSSEGRHSSHFSGDDSDARSAKPVQAPATISSPRREAFPAGASPNQQRAVEARMGEREPTVPKSSEPNFNQLTSLPTALAAPEVRPATHTQSTSPVSTPAPLPTENVSKSVQVRLGLEDSAIHLRVVERGTELHVAVSASNPEVASALRGGLPELVNSLQASGYHSEFWKAGSASGTGSSSQETDQKGHHDDAPPARQQEHGGKRQREHREDRWAQQIAEPTA